MSKMNPDIGLIFFFFSFWSDLPFIDIKSAGGWAMQIKMYFLPYKLHITFQCFVIEIFNKNCCKNGP